MAVLMAQLVRFVWTCWCALRNRSIFLVFFWTLSNWVPHIWEQFFWLSLYNAYNQANITEKKFTKTSPHGKFQLHTFHFKKKSDCDVFYKHKILFSLLFYYLEECQSLFHIKRVKWAINRLVKKRMQILCRFIFHFPYFRQKIGWFRRNSFDIGCFIRFSLKWIYYNV